MQGLGRTLVALGAILVVTGGLVLLFERVPFLKELPGNIHLRGKGFELHIPLATCLVVSLVVTLLLWVLSQFRGK